MQPLTITAFLQTPVVSDASLPIDGIIMYYAYRDALGAEVATQSGEASGASVNVALPLLKRNINDPMKRWYYAASWAQWATPVALGTDHWTKRFDAKHSDLVDFGKKRGQVIIEKGQYKAYHMPMATRHALAVTWYVVGNGDEIKRLLAHATNIGKKTAQGYGAVKQWRVEATSSDYSERGAYGQVMRPIPTDGRGVVVGFRPSYWLPRNQTRCELPVVIS